MPPPDCKVAPPVSQFPAASRILQALPSARGLTADLSEPWVTAKIGFPWEPAQFVKQATLCSHPRTLECSVPLVLRDTIQANLRDGYVAVGQDRTAAMRKWLLRKQELADVREVEPKPFPKHCQRIFAGKSIPLFEEILNFANFGDVKLADTMRSGFALMGQIPESGVLPTRVSLPSLRHEEVRKASSMGNKVVWNATNACRDPDIATAVYDATMEEKGNGWLEGPFSLEDLPEGAILTRRFGVVQTCHDVSRGTVRQVRPIDDYTESLINLTNGSTETISPHGVDVVLAASCLRLRLGRKLGTKEELSARTIDLRKAYKQLPLAESCLADSFLCVLNPKTGQPEACRALVLPFGARSSVQGFFRVSFALFWLGVVIFRFHWTTFFDDFFLVGAQPESKHLDLIQSGFFALLGWQTSDEKGEALKSVVCALRLEISSADGNMPHRVQELRDAIDRVLGNGRVAAPELVSLRGRLLFAECQVFGRKSGRAMKTKLTRA